MSARCAHCDGLLDDGFAFCPRCGSPVAVPDAGPTHERKVVTCLFCDLVSSTAAADGADPEDVRARLAALHAAVRSVLETYGGTVEKFAGDAVLATFGAPVVREDDAERAVRAGLAILDELARINSRTDLDLHVRIGVNTGETVVDLTSTADSGTTLVFGDVVNTAARIEASAHSDTIVIADTTRRLIDGMFEVEHLPALAARGKSESVAVWRIVRARARLGVDVLRSFDTPLIGRDAERTFLSEALSRARDGAGGGVLVVGEPGVGKSRLVATLLAEVEARSELITLRQGRCLPYGAGITYWALADIVKAQAGVEESDTTATATAKLDATLVGAPDPEVLRARLLPLLGIDTGLVAARDDSFRAWTDYLCHIAGTSLMVLVFEDVHWADDSMLAFLSHLDAHVDGLPILIVCTTRPSLVEADPDRLALRYGALRVSTLDGSHVEALIDTLLATVDVAEATRSAIVEQSGGNPLYAEELCRAVRDLGASADVDGRLPLPDTLQGVISARLDALPRAAKSLLQSASVIGKTFSGDAIRGIAELHDADASPILDDLVRRELLHEVPRSLGSRTIDYSFWHVLVRDAAYGSLPRADRLAAHVRFITWLSATSGDRVDEVSEILALQCEAAHALATAVHDPTRADELSEQTRAYALMAGRRAHGLDTEAAVRWLEKARSYTPADHPAAVETACLYGGALFDMGRFTDVLEVLAPVWEEAKESPRSLERQFVFQGCIDFFNANGFINGEGSGVDMQSLIENAIGTLDESPGLAYVLGAYTSWLLLDTMTPDPRRVVEVADRAIEMAIRTGGTDALAECTRGVALSICGDGDAYAGLDAIMDRERQRVRPTYALFSFGWQTLADLHWSGSDVSLARADAALEFARARGMDMAQPLWVGTRATLSAAAGRLEGAITDQEWISRNDLHVETFAPEITRVRLEAGIPVGDLPDRMEEAISDGRAIPLIEASMRTVLGHLSANAGDLAAARAHARATDPTLGETPWFIEWLGPYGRLLSRLGLGEELRALRDRVPKVTPAWSLARRTLDIQLAHLTGDHNVCRTATAPLVEDWMRFTNRLEAAYAQRLLAECLADEGDAGAAATARAREMFATMGVVGLGNC